MATTTSTPLNFTRALMLGALVCLPVALGACEAKRQAEVPAGASPQPIGSSVNEFFRRQAKKAEADDFVFYRYEWAMGGTELGEVGERHLEEILPRLWRKRWTVVIEPSGDLTIDEARREVMVSRLTMENVPDATELVIVQRPSAEGISGEEADFIEDRFPYGGRGGGSGAGSIGN